MTMEKPPAQLELERQGWTRQFTTDDLRLSEAVAIYRSLGLDVHLEPVLPGSPDAGCGACYKSQCSSRQEVVIYTRATSGKKGESEELGPIFEE